MSDGNEVWFEDMPVGTVIESVRRDITLDDLVAYNQITHSTGKAHNDPEAARQYGFKATLVPGPFILAASLPLHHRRGEHKVLALLGFDGMRFKAPVHPGDQIRLISEVKSARDTSKPDRGVVVLEDRVLNQRDELVMEHTRTVLWAKRPA